MITTVTILSATLLWSDASMRDFPFQPDLWEFKAATAERVQHLGREALLLHGGDAYLREIETASGTLEFDIAFDPIRTFVGAFFRRQNQGDYEHVYLRPHQSGKPDASQYTPVFHGVSGWQLYHGPGFAAPIAYPENAWIPVRIAFHGRRADVFIGNLQKPAFQVSSLRRDEAKGRLGLSASSFGPAWFSRVRICEDPPRLIPLVDDSSDQTRPPGTIEAWSVSETIDLSLIQKKHTLEADAFDNLRWQALPCEEGDFANLARVQGLAPNRNTALARVWIDSERAQTRELKFGFSDRVAVFLNRRCLYRGDNTYQSRDFRYLGTIGYFDSVHLPLEEGENELLIAVTESFGGWGLQAKLDTLEGLELFLPEPEDFDGR